MSELVIREKCYMCDCDATSVEHVPAKCIFPERKDAKLDLRVNLITIPSCEKHNSAKSSDDEFLMVSIAGIIGNNSIGFQHYNGKIQRALKRTSYKLLDKVFSSKNIYRMEDKNKFIDVLIGTPDYNRLLKCFDHIFFGIHRYHFKENFFGKIKTHLNFIIPHQKNPQSFKDFIKHKAEDELRGKQKFGDNLRVFYYQISDVDKFGIFLIKLCFYENVIVYGAFCPVGEEKPTLLSMELMNAGIKTFINHGGKSYEFN